MFPKFGDVLAALEDLKERELITDYAIFGAIAQMFWDEAIPTFDLDVLVLTKQSDGLLVSLDWLYRWAEERGYRNDGEHIFISEIPVQFVPAPTALHEEAIQAADTLDFGGRPVRVVRPEYLIATWLQPPANTGVRRERAARMREYEKLDHALLDDLMRRYALSW